MNTPDLIGRARHDFGDLFDKIVVLPKGLGIDVRLIGGAVSQYYGNGDRYEVFQPSALTRAGWFLAAVQGRVRG